MSGKTFATSILCLLVVVGFAATAATGADILFVSSLETDHMPGDDAIKAFFEGLGHTVTYIDDDEDEPTTEAAAAAADLVYISESVGSGAIREEITEIETPMIVGEPYAWDEMGLTTDTARNQIPDSVNITIVSAGHPMAAGYSGDVPVFTGLSGGDLIPVGTTGGGAVVIATASGDRQTDAHVLFVYEKDAALAAPPADGSPQVAADTRIGFFAASPVAQELLSTEGQDLLSAAVDYALGMTNQARNPNPLDGAVNVTTSQLQWSAGYTAKWHDVYFGTSPILGAADLRSERQTDTTYTPEAMSPGMTYYWRIDEVEADGTTVHTGIVWSFSTATQVASTPNPPDGATDVHPQVSLGWAAGSGAATHDVYLGTSQAAVADATTSSPEFKANQPGTTYARGALAKGVTHYWRIDEVEANGTTKHKGNIWSFTTKSFVPVVIERQINWTSDDNEEEVPSGDMVGMGDNDLEMPYATEGTPPTDDQIVGIRFEDIDVPKGSTISQAWVRFDVDETKNGTDPVSLIIEGERSPDAVTFTDEDYNISSRTRTTAQVVWVPDDWTATHQKHNTSNIASVIQEIVNQGGWTAGNALVLIISDDPANPSRGIRCAESWNGAGSNVDQIPMLHIEFTSGHALEPDPADGALYPDTQVRLGWMPGDTAVSRDVYFGDDFADVEAGTGGTDLGNTTDTYYDVGFGAPGDPYPGGLVPGTTYYWRIDAVEADGTTRKGTVWSFTVPPKTAYDPTPIDGGKFVQTDATLSWMPGLKAVEHNVYFGESLTDVTDGTGGTSKGSVTDAAFVPDPLATDTTYYWRIDEFDGSATVTGDVWRFRTLPDVAVTNPNLIGWWKFDEGSGTIAVDSSGHGNHGTLGNNPQRVAGFDGDALEFDGTNYVDLPTGLIGTDKGTVTMWIRTTQGTQGHIFYGSEGTSGDGFGSQYELHVNVRSNGGVESFIEGDPDVRPRTSAINDDTWRHVAVTWDINGDMTIYLDGSEADSVSHNGNSFILAGRIRLGRPNDYERYYFGLLDDLRLFDYALSPDEIAETMKGDTRRASDPSPADGSTTDIERVTTLSWSPGDMASKHDVYFGTDEDAVANADTSTAGIYRGQQTATNYAPPEALEWSRTYYWRIDEINTDGSLSEGQVWSFTIADYLVVDDFEDYNDYSPDRIFQTWIDGFGYSDPPPGQTGNGTGSTVGYLKAPFAEQTIVHEGIQSMPMDYNNIASPFYSEAGRTWDTPQDWTREDVKALTLHFRGYPRGFVESPAGT
ncbi:MAG: LamG domain-containing protein, partial [Phycisphaerales bacterium]